MRRWFRGLTVLDQSVIPVVSPEGFLTADELFLLDALVSRMVVPETAARTRWAWVYEQGRAVRRALVRAAAAGGAAGSRLAAEHIAELVAPSRVFRLRIAQRTLMA